LSVITIPAVSILLLKNNTIQNYLAQNLISRLTALFGSKVTIRHVDLDIFNQLVISDLYIGDYRNDTLVFAHKAIVVLDNLNLIRKIIKIDKVELSDAYVHLYIDSTRTVNIKYIVDRILNNSDSTKKGWNVKFNNIGFINSKFILEDCEKSKTDTGINLSYIRLNQLNIRVRNLTVNDGMVSFKINKLSLIENSGFQLENLTAEMSIRKNKMHFDNVHILTKNSDIKAPRIYFDFNLFNDFTNFAKNVKIQFQIDKSKSSFADIAYFARSLWGMKEDFSISGSAKGKLSDLKCKKIKLKIGNSNEFSGNIDFSGLPNFHETFMFIDAKNLTVTPEEFESYFIPFLPSNKLSVPDIIKKFGKISYNGTFTGYIDDFVTYGTFQTKLGEITTDLSLKPKPHKQIDFKGKIDAKSFDVGKFLNLKNISGLADVKISGDGSIVEGNKVSGSFDGLIHNLELNGYNFSDIEADGSMLENVFTGTLSLNDPNAKLALNGLFDFSKKIPEFNFTGNVSKVDLHKLNFISKDSIFNISCQLTAVFNGVDFNNLNGHINFENTVLNRNSKHLNIGSFTLLSDNIGQSSKLELKSNIVDASIDGKQDFEKLIPDLIQSLRFYMPESFYTERNYKLSTQNDFKFYVNLKEPQNLLNVFFPNILLAKNSTFSGNFHSIDSILEINLQTNFLQIGDNKFNNLKVKIKSNRDSLNIIVKSSKINSGENINFPEFSSIIKISNDSIKSNIKWINADSLTYSNILSYAYFKKDSNKNRHKLYIDIAPSKFYLLDSMWQIDACHLNIDSSKISIPSFKLVQNDQIFEAKGLISENNSDSLFFKFQNFNLNNLKIFIRNKNIKFDGKMNGTAELNDYYNKMIFNSDLKVNQLYINNELIGKTNINIQWNSLLKKFIVQANSYKDETNTAQIQGYYIPENKNLNFDIKAENIGISLFQPIISNIFTLHNGIFSGEIALTGTTTKPELNGNVEVKNCNLTVNQLNTSYIFATKLKIQDNKFIFKDIIAHDKDNNLCTINGYIMNNYFNDFKLNIDLDFNKLMVLNTSSDDNWPIYGKAYASGFLNISGSPDNIKIDVAQARTEKNTIIYIPLNKKGDVAENNFLTFYNKSSSKNIDSNEMIIKKPKIPTGVTFNLTLTATPDAEVQLIFDPKIGDILRSQGNGNIKIEVNSEGNFKINGDYVVTNGDYLFTLQNLINKKFILEPGGVISWNGNPIDATLDIKATYRTKASLSNLTLDQSPEYKTRIPVDCQLFISGKLLDPTIKYNIILPNASEESKNVLKEYITSEEELSNQFLMLLVINNFMPPSSINYGSNSTTVDAAQTALVSSFGKDIATTTSLELLSSQLSNWMSQISKDFDVGVNYRPGDKTYTNQEVEVALSTQLLNDRVSINGNFDVYGNQSNTALPATTASKPNNLVGDVSVDVKLTDDGKLRLKAFNRVNDQLTNNQEPYTQGVGLLYHEDFKSFADLRRKYFEKLFGKKKLKQNKKVELPKKELAPDNN
jgi:hypothetical protein